MIDVTTARHRARLAIGPQDMARAQSLRHLAFRGGPGLDCDPFDDAACQILVESQAGEVLATFRFRLFPQGADLDNSYVAQFYDLSAFAAQAGPKAEVGRLCLHPDATDPEVLRLTWAALARLCLGQGVRHLFGCSSFSGAAPLRHGAALAWLNHHALGPDPFRPRPKAGAGISIGGPNPDPKDLPQLLRFYLQMGAWVADHAMIDPDLDTVFVFVALDVSTIPKARTKALRALAAHGQRPGMILADMSQ